MSYALLRAAIIGRQSVSAMYQGRLRHFSPHAIGRGNDGEVNVMTFQYGGQSSQPLPPDGDWRCFRVGGLSGVQVNGDAFRSGGSHSRPNTCVTQIDVSV